jgi:hypothetical protein
LIRDTQYAIDWPRNQSCRQLPEQAASLTIGVLNDTLAVYSEDRIG